MNFFILEVLIGGLLTGVLYSLVALGFVLIFKASGVFNFAQGAMCLFAALALVRLMEVMPTALALLATAALMLALAVAIERLVLRPLVNQEGLILFMATIGITFFINGFGQALFGSDVYALDLGIPKNPLILFEGLVSGGLLVNEFDLWAAVVAGLLVGAGEKLSEVFLGPHLGGGIENCFAYVLALLVLLVRPQGLFGERIIERV